MVSSAFTFSSTCASLTSSSKNLQVIEEIVRQSVSDACVAFRPPAQAESPRTQVHVVPTFIVGLAAPRHSRTAFRCPRVPDYRTLFRANPRFHFGLHGCCWASCHCVLRDTKQRMVWDGVARAAISDDNPAVQFGKYIVRIAHHVALDCGETKDWVLNRLAGAGSADEEVAGEPAVQERAHVAPVDENGPGSQQVASSTRKKILILMSDTGGGHRASANAIKAALHHLEPESGLEVKIVDVLEEHTLWFSNRLYSWYVTYPVVWETIYNTTKSTHGKPWPIDTSKFLEFTVRAGFRRCIAAEKPDLVLSVHPILQCIPLASFMPPNELYAAPRPIPFVTVVTDLGDAVCVFLYEFACTQIHD